VAQAEAILENDLARQLGELGYQFLLAVGVVTDRKGVTKRSRAWLVKTPTMGKSLICGVIPGECRKL
jgi:hypothetical protein